MTTTTKTPALTVDQANAAAAKAQKDKDDAQDEATALAERVTELETRLKGGDRSVSYTELGEAQQKAHHAALLSESHDATVEQAHQAVGVAKFHDGAHRLAALDKRFQDTLDRIAGPVVDQLVELLGALDAAHTDYRGCADTIASVHQAVPGKLPSTLALNHGSQNRPYLPAVAVPEVDTLVGELLAAAFERAFGCGGDLNTKVIRLTTNQHSIGGQDALDLARKWIGARQPNWSQGQTPKFVTVERA